MGGESVQAQEGIMSSIATFLVPLERHFDGESHVVLPGAQPVRACGKGIKWMGCHDIQQLPQGFPLCACVIPPCHQPLLLDMCRTALFTFTQIIVGVRVVLFCPIRVEGCSSPSPHSMGLTRRLQRPRPPVRSSPQSPCL
jgi:hypothetical protein